MLAVEAPRYALAMERMAPAATGDGPAAAPDALLGVEIGHWRVVRGIGRGGMGTVYSAERADGEYRQEAALKLVSLDAGGAKIVERFRTERQVLARLGHPNVARLLDGGLAPDGRPYLVMEYVDGAPITAWCRERQLSIPIGCASSASSAMRSSTRIGALVVHRDLKPANIFVSRAGEVKLLDFGIAKLLEPTTVGVDGPSTRGEQVPFTPEYAAPEQLLREAITTATDVYALGVVLYELLTGVRPPWALRAERVPPPSEAMGRRRADDLDGIVAHRAAGTVRPPVRLGRAAG